MQIQAKAVAALVAVTGLLVSGYLLGPVPGATANPAAPAPPPQPATTITASAPTTSTPTARLSGPIKAARPPVPLVVSTPRTYFVPNPADAEPAVVPAMATATLPFGDMAGASAADRAAARAAIEQDGYRNVRALQRGADGMWHAHALRGSTEIVVSVDAGGSVSTN